MPTSGYVLIVILLLLLVPISGLWFVASQSKKNIPENVGNGSLAEGPSSPNWVSSNARENSRDETKIVEPLTFTGDTSLAWENAQAAVAKLPNTKIIASDEKYLHAECSTPIFGFVDDLELLLRADQGRIEIRSASRVGHSDLGANRKRVLKLRSFFEANGAQ